MNDRNLKDPTVFFFFFYLLHDRVVEKVQRHFRQSDFHVKARSMLNNSLVFKADLKRYRWVLRRDYTLYSGRRNRRFSLWTKPLLPPLFSVNCLDKHPDRGREERWMKPFRDTLLDVLWPTKRASLAPASASRHPKDQYWITHWKRRCALLFFWNSKRHKFRNHCHTRDEQIRLIFPAGTNKEMKNGSSQVNLISSSSTIS